MPRASKHHYRFIGVAYERTTRNHTHGYYKESLSVLTYVAITRVHQLSVIYDDKYMQYKLRVCTNIHASHCIIICVRVLSGHKMYLLR